MSIEPKEDYNPSPADQAAEAEAMLAVVRAFDAYLPHSVRPAARSAWAALQHRAAHCATQLRRLPWSTMGLQAHLTCFCARPP